MAIQSFIIQGIYSIIGGIVFYSIFNFMGIYNSIADPLFLICLLLFFADVEWYVRWMSSRIQNAKFKSIFGWSMFCISRFVCYDQALSVFGHSSVLVNGFRSDESIWRSIYRLASIIAIPTLCCLILWLLFHVLPFGISFLINTKKQLNDRSEKGIYFNQASMWPRHIHPKFDIINFIYEGSYVPSIGFQTKCSPAVIFDNNRRYDPAWPNCSIVHSIMVFMCDHCSKDNGLHIFRTSLDRRQTRSLWYHPQSYPSIDQLLIRPFESNGLILISIVHEAGHDLLITDLRSGKMISLDLESLFPSPIFMVCYAIHDDGSELGDRKTLSSIYLRVIYYFRDPVLAISNYGHSLVEVPLIDGSGGPRKLSQVNHSWPAGWKVRDHGFFPMPCDRVGFRAKFHHPVHGGRMESIIWDPSRKEMIVMDSHEDFIMTDLRFRLFIERYHEYDPDIILVNDTEAIVIKRDWSIWRTSFQPPSLKSSCLKKICGTNGKKLGKFSSQDWLEMTGVDADAYFEGKKVD